MNTILIVDDSPTIRRMVRTALERLSKVNFVEAGNGLEAIESLAVAAVRMIVLDLNMPDMHGLDVLKFIRSHDRYRAVPVIVLTTRGDEASRNAAVGAGATAFLTKPFSPEMLAARAGELLQTEGGLSDAAVPEG